MIDAADAMLSIPEGWSHHQTIHNPDVGYAVFLRFDKANIIAASAIAATEEEALTKACTKAAETDTQSLVVSYWQRELTDAWISLHNAQIAIKRAQRQLEDADADYTLALAGAKEGTGMGLVELGRLVEARINEGNKDILYAMDHDDE